MDTLSHALLGAVAVQLGIRQRIGRDATWVAAVAAMLPDLDTLAVPLMSLTSTEVDDLARITIHRGLSHSLLAAPVLALAVAGLWWWLRRRWTNARRWAGADAAGVAGLPARKAPSFGLLYGCTLLAAICHPLLDWCTSYGTQLLAPLTSARFSLDAIPIVDVFITPLLIVTLLACWVVRKVRHSVSAKATTAIAAVGMAMFVGYVGAGRVMRSVAINHALAVAGPVEVLRADAYPTIGSILLWRTVLRTENGWQVSAQHILSDRPGEPAFAPQVSNEWVAKAEDLDAGRTFRWFAQGRIRTSYTHRNGQRIVELHDMRYGPGAGSVESLWGLRVAFDSNGQPTQVDMVSTFHRHGSFLDTAGRLWREMWRP